MFQDLIQMMDGWHNMIDSELKDFVPESSKRTQPVLLKSNLPVDIKECEKYFEVIADIPGVAKESVKITVKDHILMIQGERSGGQKSDSEVYHRTERYYGECSRSIRLPENVNEDALEAAFSNGVLSIKIPKMMEDESKKVKTIKIQ
jgi:HSP20 family protein